MARLSGRWGASIVLQPRMVGRGEGEYFSSLLEKAVGAIQPEDSSKPLLFFIDELDRCRPTFAIEMLERIKHLFDVKNMVFVLSIDKKQLEAITAAVYGERIDASEYLRRFIDLVFTTA